MPEVPLILVWPEPGQPDSAIRALLDDVAADLIVAVWDPADDDGGRAALLASVREARDVLARVLYGARVSLSIGFLAELITAYQGRDADTYSIAEEVGAECGVQSAECGVTNVQSN